MSISRCSVLYVLLLPIFAASVCVFVNATNSTFENHASGVNSSVDRAGDVSRKWPITSLWLLSVCVAVPFAVRLVPDGSMDNLVLNGLSDWLESTAVPSAVTRSDGRMILSNDELIKILPELLTAAEHGAFSLHELLSENSDEKSEVTFQKLQAAICRCLDGPVPQSMQVRCTNKRCLAVTIAAQIDHKGAKQLLVWSIQETGQQQRLQQRDLHSEKMEAIARLAGGIAHEFNNLLTAVLGNLELIRSRPDAAVSQVVGNLESAEVAALRASQLIQELRRFASREASRREIKSVVPSVRKVRRILAGMVARNIEVSHSFENESQLFAEINSSQLEDALLKLGINSAEAIGNNQEGQIHFSIAAKDGHQHTNGQLEILISDSGHGMDATIRDRAFEPFFTTKDSEKSFGLGMAIAYGLIEEMGGTISIANTSETGSQISVSFPLQADQSKNGATVSDSSVHESPVQLLIAMVDNELSIRNVASGMLKFLGHQVVLFSDGTNFLKAIQDGQSFDLVLLDNVMPGMTGRSTYEKMRGMNADIPVIICSGRSLNLDTFCSISNHQPNAFLAKPFTILDLSSAIAPFTRRN